VCAAHTALEIEHLSSESPRLILRRSFQGSRELLPTLRQVLPPRRRYRKRAMSKTITEDPEGQPGQTGLKRRPSRNLSLPEPPTDRTLDFAASRPELRNIDPGETVLAVEALEGFERVIKPILDRIDASARLHGPARASAADRPRPTTRSTTGGWSCSAG
jgi:hypothetical protein